MSLPMTSSGNDEASLVAFAQRGGLPSRRDEGRALALAELSEALAESITDTGAVVNRVVELVSRVLGDIAVLRLLDDEGAHVQVAAAADVDPRRRDLIRRLLVSAPTDVADLAPFRAAVRKVDPLVIRDDQLDSASATFGPDASQVLRDLGVETVLTCPLRALGRVIGTLGLGRRADRGPYTERDKHFAQELADRAALAIENARLVERLRAELEERKNHEESLRLTAELLQTADEKRRALMDDLVEAQEEERGRIAVEIHDDSIQAVAAIGLRLQILRRQAPNREFSGRVSEIEDTVTEAIGRLRSLLFRLESASLEKEGLAYAIDRCAEELFPDPPPRVRVESRLSAEPPRYAQVVLVRVAQEALTNVLKHARASEITVVLSEEQKGTLLIVHDDGVGFDAEELVTRALPGHMGMRTMQQRAQAAGGWLRVESKPREGTTVRCWAPDMGAVQSVIT
jgi:signal transduction histidine kinase